MSEAIVSTFAAPDAAAAHGTPVTPDRLLALGTGYWVSQIIGAAAHHKFFTLIAAGHTTAAAVAAAAKTDPRGTRMVLDSLVAVNVLTKRGDRYALTPEADAFLVTGRPGDLSGMFVDQVALSWDAWARLADALQRPSIVRNFENVDVARDFFPKLIRAIMPLSLGAADAVAEHLGIGSRIRGARILDVGVGAAAWSIPFARRDARAHVVGFDLPEVLAETKKVVAQFGVDSQFTMRAGDMLTDDFGADAFDMVIIGNICHGLTPEQNRDLLARVRRALVPKGTVVIADMLPNEERTGPPFPVLFAVNMFVMGGADTYPLSDYRRWLDEAGYASVNMFDTKRSHSPVIIATR